jgi:uncharacterized protein YjbI with pentapeptide repeats
MAPGLRYSGAPPAPGAIYQDRRRWHAHRVLAVSGVAIAFVCLGLASALPGSSPAAADSVVGGCTIVSNPTPSHFTSCPGADLSQANLSGTDLSYADLSGATFASCPGGQDAPCYGVDLADADLHEANLSNVIFEIVYFFPMAHTNGAEANLSGADMTGADASGATLDWMQLSAVNVNLTGANFSHASLGNVGFKGSQLTNVNFSGADLTNTDFSGVVFSGDDFSGANLSDSDFSRTVLGPPDQTVNATSGAGAIVSWPTPSGVSGLTVGACSPASGSLFPIGNFTPACAVRNDTATTGIAVFGVVVVAAAPMTFITTSLPPASVGNPYSVTLSVSGGYAPYSYKVVSGLRRPPRGLRLDKSTGTISGTPAKRSSTSTFTVEALDTKTPRLKGRPATRNTVESTFTITVTP